MSFTSPLSPAHSFVPGPPVINIHSPRIVPVVLVSPNSLLMRPGQRLPGLLSRPGGSKPLLSPKCNLIAPHVDALDWLHYDDDDLNQFCSITILNPTRAKEAPVSQP